MVNIFMFCMFRDQTFFALTPSLTLQSSYSGLVEHIAPSRVATWYCTSGNKRVLGANETYRIQVRLAFCHNTGSNTQQMMNLTASRQNVQLLLALLLSCRSVLDRIFIT